MSSLPQSLLTQYESAVDREAAWVPLADWVLEQQSALVGSRPPPLEPVHGTLEFVSQLARRAYLHWVGERAASQFALEPMLRHESCALVDELRVSSHWPGSRVMLFGSVSSASAAAPPARLLPAVINAALASAPALLRRFEVWIPKNPPWADADDCRTQLEPLLRQRPRLAQHLVLRAPRRGLVELVRGVADNRWRTVTIAAPLVPEDVTQLSKIAARFQDVSFQVIDETRRDVLASNLAFVRDPDACTLEVTVEGQTTKGATAPGRMLPGELEHALLALGLDFVTDLGMNALAPRAVVKRGQLKLNSRVLLEPHFLRDGVVDVTWTKDDRSTVVGRVRRRVPGT
ncbi:MAG: hypothetical protein QM817_41350 [Archangium sp.]